MRLCLSPRIKDTRVDIETRWSIDDVMETLEWLDIAEDAEILRENYHHETRPVRGKGAR